MELAEITLKEIRTLALKFNDKALGWHFHVLTPSCSLNKKSQYAFVLECPEKDGAYVNYSAEMERELAKELSPLVHGKTVLDQNVINADYQPSKTVMRMIEKAKLLNDRKVEWHHHMLSPGCRYNTHSPQYVLMMEDSKSGEVLESLSESEPKDDLKQVEILFFKQK